MSGRSHRRPRSRADHGLPGGRGDAQEEAQGVSPRIAPELTSLAVAIAALHLDAANPRTHSARNLEAIAASLAKFGQRRPIVVQREGLVVRAGNGVVAAARGLGWTHVAALVVDEGDVSATAYAIADNRTAELAGWNDRDLGQLLQSLRDTPDFDHLVTGFTDGEIDRLVDGPAGLTDPDDVPPAPAEPVTRPGDLWVLGEHRVLCGDSTNADNVARLLDGRAPRLMVTDPPYGVEYDPAWRTEAGVSSAGAARGRVENDDRADWREAWALFPGAIAYVWHAGTFAGVVAESLRVTGFAMRAQLVWVKSRPVLSRGAYHWQHESAFVVARAGAEDAWRYEPDHELAAYAVRAGETAAWDGGRRQSTVWSIEHLKNDTGHGTQKPVECMARPMRNHGRRGDVVYDPFLGSGSSVIAAELTGRVCVGLELSPAYVDVIVARWEAFSGVSAQRCRG